MNPVTSGLLAVLMRISLGPAWVVSRRAITAGTGVLGEYIFLGSVLSVLGNWLFSIWPLVLVKTLLRVDAPHTEAGRRDAGLGSRAGPREVLDDNQTVPKPCPRTRAVRT